MINDLQINMNSFFGKGISEMVHIGCNLVSHISDTMWA